MTNIFPSIRKIFRPRKVSNHESLWRVIELVFAAELLFSLQSFPLTKISPDYKFYSDKFIRPQTFSPTRSSKNSVHESFWRIMELVFAAELFCHSQNSFVREKFTTIFSVRSWVFSSEKSFHSRKFVTNNKISFTVELLSSRKVLPRTTELNFTRHKFYSNKFIQPQLFSTYE